MLRLTGVRGCGFLGFFCAMFLFSNVALCHNMSSEELMDDFRTQARESSKPINLFGNWRVSIIEIDGAFVRVPDSSDGATLQISNNQIAGTSGCNNFMSPYKETLNPQTLHIEGGASTRKMCQPEVMKFEDAFLGIFIGDFRVFKTFEGIVLERDNIKIYLVR